MNVSFFQKQVYLASRYNQEPESLRKVKQQRENELYPFGQKETKSRKWRTWIEMNITVLIKKS